MYIPPRVDEAMDKHLCIHQYDNGEEHQWYEFNGLELEDFIKVILEECGTALNPMLRDMVSRGRAAELIKEHFGVYK